MAITLQWTLSYANRCMNRNSPRTRVIAARRGIHATHVFSYRGRPVGKLRSTAWRRAWEKAGLPMEAGILKGVHNLRHTFGRRLRGAGIPLETRKALLGHANGDITTHYSAAELGELLAAAEKIVNRGVTQSPTLTVVRRTADKAVGNASESC
jgi:integrase